MLEILEIHYRDFRAFSIFFIGINFFGNLPYIWQKYASYIHVSEMNFDDTYSVGNIQLEIHVSSHLTP